MRTTSRRLKSAGVIRFRARETLSSSLLGLLAFLCFPGCAADSGPLEGPAAEGAPDYGLVYDTTRVNTFKFEISYNQWARMPVKIDGEFVYVPAKVTFTGGSGVEVYENVGLRFKGNSSYFASGPKKSFKIHFNEYDPDCRFHGLKKINLNNSFNDPSLMRELLACELFREAGVPASRVSYADLTITVPGLYDDVYYGVYFNIEQVNKAFCLDRFGNDDGNLYKAEGFDSSLEWLGSNPAAYHEDYVLKTNERENDYSDLIHLVDVIDNTPNSLFREELEKVLNVDGFIRWLAVNTILSFQDSYAGTGHNFYLYHNLTTGKFEFIPWDLNTTFGQSRFGKPADYFLTLDIYNPTFGHQRVLIDRVLAEPVLRAQYETVMRDLVTGVFNNTVMDARIETNYALIRNLVHLDTMKDFTNTEFDLAKDQDIPDAVSPNRTLGLKPYVMQRRTNILAQLP